MWEQPTGQLHRGWCGRRGTVVDGSGWASSEVAQEGVLGSHPAADGIILEKHLRHRRNGTHWDSHGAVTTVRGTNDAGFHWARLGYLTRTTAWLPAATKLHEAIMPLEANSWK